MDNKAVLVARVAEIRARSRESSAARVIVLGAVVIMGRSCSFGKLLMIKNSTGL